MARALWVLILVTAVAFAPDMAAGQKGRPGQRAQQEASERQAFEAQQRACLQGDLTACEQALAFSKLTAKNRDILQAKRWGIVAARQAAERERRDAEAAERLRLEREHLQLERERLAALEQNEILAHNAARVPRTSPIWTAVTVLAAILGASTALLVALVGDVRSACLQFMTALQHTRLPRPSWHDFAELFALRPKLSDPVADRRGPAASNIVASPASPGEASAEETPPLDTAGAIAALELAQAYLEEVRDADVPEYEDATMRKLHLNTLALATKQLEAGQKLDPDAFLEGRDALGNLRRLGFNELRAEAFLLEGLTHQAYDVRRAIVALMRATELRPDNPHAFFALGLTQAATGNKSAAVKALHQAVAINPKSVIYRKELNRAENLTAVEVAGYRSTRVGDKMLNAEISRWSGVRHIARLLGLPGTH